MELEQLEQQIVVSEGEDPWVVAEDLIGPKGKAELQQVKRKPGDQWPTAYYTGTRQELAAIRAKANGSAIGKPKSI